MANRYENYITGDDGFYELKFMPGVPGRPGMAAQTFTPSVDHIIIKVKLLMYRVGSPGIVGVAIRSTVGGKPDDSIEELASGTFDGNALTTDTAGDWKEVEVTPNLGVAGHLVANTLYAIGVEAWGGTVGNYPVWRLDGTSPTYVDGQFGFSEDGGGTWTMDSGKDAMFEEWGVPSIYPSDAVSRVSSIRHIFRPSMFRMELSLGDLGFDVDVAEATVRKALDVAKEPVEGEPPVEPPPAREVPGLFPGHYIDIPEDDVDEPVIDIRDMLFKKPDLMDVYREMGLLAGMDPEFEAMRKRGEKKFRVWRAAYDETPGTVADKTRAGIEALHRAGLTRHMPTDPEAGMREMGLLPDVGGITIRRAQRELEGLQAHPLFREEFAGMTLKEYIAKYLTPGGE